MSIHRQIEGGNIDHRYLISQHLRKALQVNGQTAFGHAADAAEVLAKNLASSPYTGLYSLALLSVSWGYRFVDHVQEQRFEDAEQNEMHDVIQRNDLAELLEYFGGLQQRSDGVTNKMQKYNGNFLAFKDSDSSMLAIQAPEDETSAVHPNNLFPEGQESEWPMLILTSNTSSARDSDDLAVIMHGCEQMYYNAYSGKPPHTPVVVSQIQSRENSQKNGATLIRRIRHIQEDHGINETEQDTHPDQMERRNLIGITPDAVRLGNLILACLLEDPSQINVSIAPDGPLEENSPFPDVLRDRDNAKLLLRKDAAQIMKHIKLMGFSRGGNIASDAWRYVARQMHPNNGAIGDHVTAKQFFTRDDSGETHVITQDELKELTSALKVMSLSAWETPMSQKERELGFHRLTFANEYDYLVTEFIRENGGEKAYKENLNDMLFVVSGKNNGLAHAPREAMLGERDDPKSVGYFCDPNVKCLRKGKPRSDGKTPIDVLKTFFDTGRNPDPDELGASTSTREPEDASFVIEAPEASHVVAESSEPLIQRELSLS